MAQTHNAFEKLLEDLATTFGEVGRHVVFGSSRFNGSPSAGTVTCFEVKRCATSPGSSPQA